MSSSRTRVADTPCTAFDGFHRIAAGPLGDIAPRLKRAAGRGSVLVFDDTTGAVVDVDYRGTDEEVAARLALRDGPGAAADAGPHDQATARGRGRPRLGVIAREVTLLPRHWAWLAGQPGGASVALRRLVDEARRSSLGRDRVRRSQEVAYRFMSALAGNLPGFEEAIRGLFAGNSERFVSCMDEWPADVRRYAQQLAEDAFTALPASR